MNPSFSGGVNIAVKIPKYKYQETVAFYRDILKLKVQKVETDHPTVSESFKVEFGPNTLWLDCVNHCTHAETWLELKTPDVENATDYLKSKGIEPRDELEKIPKGMHWFMDPAGTVFILDKEK